MTGKHTTFSALLVLLASALASADQPATAPASGPSATQPSEATIRALVKRLDSPSPLQREQAMDHLLELGEAAYPALRQILESGAQQLSAEQRTQIQTLLQSGPAMLLEKRSGLSPASLDTLRRLRAQPVESNNEYHAFDSLDEITDEPAITDQGLALVAQVALQRATASNTNQQSFVRYRLISLISKVTAHAAAGPITGTACGEWLRNAYLPAMQNTEKRDLLANPYEAQLVVMRLVVNDWLNAADFEQVFDSFCRTAERAQDEDAAIFNYNDRAFFIGFAWSRHCTARHIGDLVRMLALDGDRRGCEGANLAGSLVGSPHFNAGHARALVAWFLERSEPPPWCARHLDEFMWRLTGTTLRAADDADARHPGGRESVRVAAECWRNWWTAHAEQPLARPQTQPGCRYVAVQFDATDPAKPVITVIADTELQIGSSRMIHAANRPGLAMLVQLAAYQSADADASDRPAWQQQCLSLDLWTFDRGEANTMRSPIFPGEVCLGAQPFFWQDNEHRRAKTVFALSLVIDATHAQQAPTQQQVSDPAWWEQLLLTAATAMELAATPDEGSADRPAAASLRRFPISALDELRSPGLEAGLRRLQTQESPLLAAAAGYQLAKWELNIDTERMLKLLEATEPNVACRAATALGLAGRIEGPDWLIAHAHTEGPAGPAWSALMDLAEGKGFEGEARRQLAAKIITTLVPTEESAVQPAFRAYLLARVWSGQEFKYTPGADPETNRLALARYHDWAQRPAGQ